MTISLGSSSVVDGFLSELKKRENVLGIVSTKILKEMVNISFR